MLNNSIVTYKCKTLDEILLSVTELLFVCN